MSQRFDSPELLRRPVAGRLPGLRRSVGLVTNPASDPRHCQWILHNLIKKIFFDADSRLLPETENPSQPGINGSRGRSTGAAQPGRVQEVDLEG